MGKSPSVLSFPTKLVPLAVHRQRMVMHPAPKRYLLHYPLRGGRTMNLIGCGQAASWEEEGWAIPATNDEFAAAYADVAPHLLALIRSIPAGALFKWGLRDREPLATWVLGRVAMLGDAAHPMTPFLGQGACIAIEDALVLGRAFEASATVHEALNRYEAARRNSWHQCSTLVARRGAGTAGSFEAATLGGRPRST